VRFRQPLQTHYNLSIHHLLSLSYNRSYQVKPHHLTSKLRDLTSPPVYIYRYFIYRYFISLQYPEIMCGNRGDIFCRRVRSEDFMVVWYYFGKDPKLTHAINRAKNKNKKLQNLLPD